MSRKPRAFDREDGRAQHLDRLVFAWNCSNDACMTDANVLAYLKNRCSCRSRCTR